jgi:signal transduction histidine kinase
MNRSIEEVLITNGNKIIQNYQASSSTDLVSFMENFSGISGTLIQVYNKDGTPLLDVTAGQMDIDRTYIDRVVGGTTVRNMKKAYNQFPVIGLPLRAHGEPYALFLSARPTGADDVMNKEMYAMYIIVLVVGSVLILIASRYIVKPLLKLTDATRRMAKGKFDITLRTKRKDEIGILTVSFNEMASELAKIDRMRQDFVSNVSHEIQSPLTSIIGFAKALKQKKMSEESKQHYLTIIEDESERLSRLSQNLLRLSSLQHEQNPLKVSTYRLDEQLRKVVIGLEPQWDEKEIEMVLFLDSLTITADQDQLNQVWMNLLSNSIKFTPIHGEIVMVAKAKDHHIIVSITDTGPGIPEEERADIFKPFYKIDKSRDRSVKGNGLGLSIVKQIVDLHNGDIEVSGQLGHGTTFTVKLPQQSKDTL